MRLAMSIRESAVFSNVLHARKLQEVDYVYEINSV
jgi:hypothetical protein